MSDHDAILIETDRVMRELGDLADATIVIGQQMFQLCASLSAELCEDPPASASARLQRAIEAARALIAAATVDRTNIQRRRAELERAIAAVGGS